MKPPNASSNSTQNTQPTITTKVACIGDSITELSGYPNHISQSLGNKYTVGNFGACGTTVSLDSYSPYLHTEAYTNAKNFQPDIAVIMLGTNDAEVNGNLYGGNFLADYQNLIVHVQAFASNPKVHLVLPPPIYSNWGGLSSEVLQKEIVPAIKQLAKNLVLPLIDVNSALANPRFFLDGVHPNDEGAKIIASTVCKAITL